MSKHGLPDKSGETDQDYKMLFFQIGVIIRLCWFW